MKVGTAMTGDRGTRCNVCGGAVEDRGYKHAQCPRCGQVSNLCCDPEIPATGEEPSDAAAP